MSSPLRRLAGNTAIYSLGTLFAQLVGFLLLPLYTRVLTPSDYGALSLMLIVQSVTALFVELAVTSGVVRHYHAHTETQSRNRLVATGLFLVLGSSLLWGISLQLSAPWLAPVIFDFENAVRVFRVSAITGALMPVALFGLRLLQLDQKPLRFVGFSFAQFLVSTTLTIWLVAWARWGVLGVLWGQLAGVALQSAASLARAWPYARAGFDMQQGTALMRFSLPLVPTNLAALTMALSDRFFLEKLASLHETGIYSVADKMVAVLQVLAIGPFGTAVAHLAFARQKDPDLPAFIARVLRLYAAGVFTAILGYSLVIRELLWVATTPAYADAWTLVPVLCAAPLAQGAVSLAAIGIHLANRTSLTPLFFGISTACNLSLNALWIPDHGAAGAAAATAVSSGLNAALFLLASQRVWPAPHTAIPLIASVSCGFAALATLLYTNAHSGTPSLLWRAGLFVAFLLALLLSGGLPRAEIQAIRRAIAGWRRRSDRGDRHDRS